jgi:hypothetical protein
MEILREELKFAKFIIRMQQNFAGGILDSFITHLKLREMWDDYKLKEPQFTVAFNAPTNFYEMRKAQELELKVGNYGSLAGDEMISNSYAQKKYMGWSDVDVKGNREWMRKDSELRWELSQIETGGPDWRENLAAQQDAAEGGMPPGGGMGAGPVGGGAPPAFGPPPPGGMPGAEPGAMPPEGSPEAAPVSAPVNLGQGSALPG